MAGLYPLDTPERVLKRVQAMEDMELPSLPSFHQDDLDYDTMSDDSRGFSNTHDNLQSDTEENMETPHPLRQTILPSTASTASTAKAQSPADSYSTASGSPFPPLHSRSREETPSPYMPTAALTSTPSSRPSRSQSRSLAGSTAENTIDTARPIRHERTRSGSGSVGTSTSTKRERWQTPGEMSRSFSGDEIAASEIETERSDSSIHDSQQTQEHQSVPDLPSMMVAEEEGTPTTRRLSSGNVQLERPHRRGTTNATPSFDPIHESDGERFSLPSPREELAAAAQIYDRADIPQQERIPSLSRSEVTGTDYSVNSTPEGPVRNNVSMMTPRPDAPGEYEVTDEYSFHPESHDEGENPTLDYHHQYEYTPQQEGDPSDMSEDYGTPAKQSSPVKLAQSSSEHSTPGTVRATPRVARASVAATPVVLQDITSSRQNAPFTPSPNATPKSDFETPRAPLDDAERRKSHVLAVLNSAVPSSRMRRSVRGTPHPLRRVSTVPASESIAEENSGSDFSPAAQLGTLSRLTDASGNESFVSVASSADLTTDARASRFHHLSRANTSFPILPVGPSTSAGSLKGLSDRAPNSKIHKHLNEMNKQLLETNAELAREAEAWRDEVVRLSEVLKKAGIEVGDSDVLANVGLDRSGSRDVSQRLPSPPRHLPSQNPSSIDGSGVISWPSLRHRQSASPSKGSQDLLDGLSPEERAAVVQEMAERLEGLEEDLMAREQVIVDLRAQMDSAQQSNSPDVHVLQSRIDDLALQLEQTEQARMDLQTQFSTKTEEHALKFGEICSDFEGQVQSLEKDLAFARAEAERLRSERERLESLTSAQGSGAREEELLKQVRDMEVELEVVRGNVRRRDDEIATLQNGANSARQEKESADRHVYDLERRIEELEHLHRDAEVRTNEAEAALESLGGELRQACNAQAEVEDNLARVSQDLDEAHRCKEEQVLHLNEQQRDMQELHEIIEKLEVELEKAEGSELVKEELQRVQTELDDVHRVLDEKGKEVDTLRAKLRVANPVSSLHSSQRSISSTATAKPPLPVEESADSSFVAVLEDRLDEAYREIGRLKREINATPHRQSAVDIRDAKIQALEREKAALGARLAIVNQSSTGTPLAQGKSEMMDAGSPFKRPTPFSHKAIASLRAPKTPGSFHEPSWLQTTIQSNNEPVLQAQVEYLQHELREANSQLDHNFSRLESAGFGAVELAEKLAAAEQRISELEDEIRALRQRNKASLAVVGAQRDEQDREAESKLQKALAQVHLQMDKLKSDISAERSRVQGDNRRLQDLVSEMRLKSTAEVESFKSEMERMSEDSENDVRQAREEAFKLEREKDEMKREFQAIKSQSSQLERQLSDEKRAYDSLSRRNAQTTRDVPTAVQLQSLLAHKEESIRALESSLHNAEATTHHLRQTLSERELSLKQAESRLERFRQERQMVARELGEFDKDLQRHKQESNAFGIELQVLKKEQTEKAGRHAAELSALERGLQDAKHRESRMRRELMDAEEKLEEVEGWRQTHECDTRLSEDMAKQKARFKSQSRELAAQIKYLKAKYTRESAFRNALALQKRYLLLLVGGKSLNEQATIRAIAKMGFPIPEPPRPRRTFKAVALAVISVIRAKNTAQRWQSEVALKNNTVATRSERRKVSDNKG
ncbi:hypothetical protein B9479_004010 [Cryptococcus floricola]|uniref:Pericentrin/AKAP-450 centrosomal targeting domain-containing protein n=1 Tax=Cryptococcus floricola TaxID=2591691 RepID=A0A5D3AZ20_9TREE|nr:hypothetical protein B9479_004010 [Cryptococcus floricola]